jgi:CheY-like chemotaxis protein
MAGRPRILIVDDEPFNIDLLEQELELLHYATVTAADGEQALERLATEPFDLVLLDIMMPKLDGYRALSRIKADPELRHIPVIMISALSELDSVVRCIELALRSRRSGCAIRSASIWPRSIGSVNALRASCT